MTGIRKLADRLILSHWRWIDETQRDSRKNVKHRDARPIGVFFISALMLVVLYYVVMRPSLQSAVAGNIIEWVASRLPAEKRADIWQYHRLLEHVCWAVGCIIVYIGIPGLVVKLIFRERLRDWGLTLRGFTRHLWIYVLLYLPVGLAVLVVSFTPAFQGKYPFYKFPMGLGDLLIWELFYGLQFFALEFFFRGFMLHAWKDRLGYFAIFAMMIPYCMVHFQKPWAETVGAIVAGTVLGTIALRTGSIWGGVFIHVAVAWSMDLMAILQRLRLKLPFWYGDLHYY